jgi:hypothetical protein
VVAYAQLLRKSMNSLIDEMRVAFEAAEKCVGSEVPGAQVQTWMTSPDVEVLGALNVYMHEPQYAKLIKPGIGFDDYHSFMLRYYELCFDQNPDSEWAEGRYAAGWAFVTWFHKMWMDPNVPREKIEETKRWLANLYKRADSELRTCLVNAVLEHLFENKQIAVYFKSWTQEPQLRDAYIDAMLWTEKGGQSSLTKK